MVMMGPWARLFRATVNVASKKATKKMAATVKTDVNAAQVAVKIDYKSAFKELTQDSGVSESWINKLIDRTKTPDQLSNLMDYMKNAEKTANLQPGTKKFLLKKMATKANELHEAAEAKFLFHKKAIENILEDMLDFIT